MRMLLLGKKIFKFTERCSNHGIDEGTTNFYSSLKLSFFIDEITYFVKFNLFIEKHLSLIAKFYKLVQCRYQIENTYRMSV